MAISRDQVDEIKSRVSIIDVAAERVNLSRHGSTMSCCCPFHQEKTPSCVLYEKTNSFYCFGCGTSGDVISFIRGTDNLSYVEAVQQLAQRAGITIDAKGAQLNQREQELRDRIRACNREAARYFFRSLTQDDEGSVGRTYLLNERGLSMAAVRHFGLGYAKPESFGLVNYLRDKGFTDDEMITANLAYQSKTGHVMDRFRDRIMYPIFDTVGNVIAFGGRALNKEDKAKYINTNTTPVFRKSNNLYGYNFARKAHSDHLILAEGYMDVIALQTAGFAGAVASLGTSLTEEQAKLIGRSCKELTICYDSDSAGIRATQRAIQVLRSACPELRVSVASLGEGKDPDEFIKMHPKDGAERLAEAFKAAISDTEYKYPYRLELRLNEAQMARLQSLASKSGLSMSAYVRQLIDGVLPQERPPFDFYLILSQLRYIGNNMNQLTRIAHATGRIDWKEFERLTDEIKPLASMLYRYVTEPIKRDPMTSELGTYIRKSDQKVLKEKREEERKWR